MTITILTIFHMKYQMYVFWNQRITLKKLNIEKEIQEWVNSLNLKQNNNYMSDRR